MKIGRIESKALSFCLLVAIMATYSMVALAGAGRVAGEIVVTGTAVDGNAPVVLVNGEQVKSGRSIFSSSSIITSDNATATISVGSLGTIRLAPESSVTLTFGDDGISGNLTKGSVTVLNSSDKVGFILPNGSLAELKPGMSASAAPQDDDDDDDAGAAWWPWAIVFGGAAAVIIWTAVKGDNRVDLGGGSTVVSPSS